MLPLLQQKSLLISEFTNTFSNIKPLTVTHFFSLRCYNFQAKHGK